MVNEKRGSGWKAVLCMLLAGVPAEARSQPPTPSPTPPDTWRNVRLTQENDSPIKGDERYTQGLRLDLVKETAPTWVESMNQWLGGKLWSSERKLESTFSIFAGQHMYTPDVITTPKSYPGDRGFVGALYGGAQAQFSDVDQTLRHTFEAVLGVRGDAAFAGPAQKALHVLRLRRIPKGWARQDSFGLLWNLNYRGERRMNLLPCHERGQEGDEYNACILDLTVAGLGALGNMRTAAGFSISGRVGYGLTGFPVGAIVNGARGSRRPPLEVGLEGSYEKRRVRTNGFLKSNGDGDDFRLIPSVTDKSLGGFLRYKDVRLSVLHVERSPEFSAYGVDSLSQSFASIGLSYEPTEAKDIWSPGVLRDIRVELGLGSTPIAAPLAAGGRKSGPSGRVGLSKAITGPFFAGFELGGSVVENHPGTTVPDEHNDTFMVYRAVTLGWRSGKDGSGRFSLRAGPTLFGQTAKVETTLNRPEHPKPTELRTAIYSDGGKGGWIIGGQYMMAPHRHVAFGLAITYARLQFDDVLPGIKRTSFLTATFGVEIRPTPSKPDEN